MRPNGTWSMMVAAPDKAAACRHRAPAPLQPMPDVDINDPL
jgi:hypothetical protein